MIITDSIGAPEAVRIAPNIERLSIAPLIGEAMRRISEERSISALFS
jgi:ribose-phosphate pyrophosphokinase